MKLRGLAYLLASGFWFLTPQAGAQSVAIRCSSEPEVSTAEAVTRLRGELIAMGLEVAVQELPVGTRMSPRDGRLPSTYGANATMDVSANATNLVVEIWVRSETSEPWVTLSEARIGENAPEKIAIRAAEALHSRFVEADFGREPAPATPREPVVVPLTATPNDNEAPSHERPGPVSQSPRLAVGGVALVSTRGFSPFVMPMLRLEWPLFDSLSPYVGVAGLGSESDVATAAGAASMSSSYGVIGANYFLARLGLLEPFVGLGVGAQHNRIEGRADAPLRVHDTAQWVALAELSLGAAVPLSARYYLTIAGHAQLTAPSIVVHVVDEAAAVSGRPNWGGSLAAGVRL